MSQLIPEEVVQEVLLRADIVEIISDYVQLKRTGANAKGLCPFHQEKTPSFTVSPSKGLFYCFGCHASGNVFRFLMQHEHLTFPEAVHVLAARYGVHIPESKNQDRQRQALSPLYALHQAAATFFHACLLRDPAAQAARAACRQRSITQEMAIRFGLGYAPAAWDTLYQAMRTQGFTHEVLVESGLAVLRESQRGAYDRFRNRLMFPIHDRLGRPVAFGGRALEGSEAVHVPKYLNSPETPIFHKGRMLYGFNLAKAALRQREQALIVEGYTDVIACHRQGVTHAVGTLGTALTEQHVALLKGLIKEVVLVFDGDAAGSAATERSIGLFLEAGLRVRVVTLPEGEDPDSFLRQHSGEELLQAVEEAVSFVDFLLTRAGRFTELRSPTGRADCVARLLPLLRKIDSQVERWSYVALVAERLGVPAEVLQHEMYGGGGARQQAPQWPSPGARPAARPPRPTPVSAEYALLQMVCHDVHLLDRVQPQVSQDDFADPDLQAIYGLLLRLAPHHPQSVFPQIIDAASNDRQVQVLTQMAMEPVLSNSTELAAALQDCLAKIRQRNPKARRRRIIAQLHSAREAGDSAEEQRLLQEFNQLTKEQPIGSSLSDG
ncbi:MAG: DNA primase [Candidatus Tectimicrobiota bacterium]